MMSNVENSSNKRKPTWERRLNQAKKKHRPSLKNWSISDFAGKRNHDFLRLLDNSKIQTQVIQINSPDEIHQYCHNDSLDVIHKVPCEILSRNDFIQFYEEKKIPVIIQNIPKVENWKGHELWDFHYFKRKLFKDRYFKVGEDDDGYKVKVRMKYFLKYLKTNRDDSPLYIFDGNYDNDAVAKQLLDEYQVPSYFTDDLFRYYVVLSE